MKKRLWVIPFLLLCLSLINSAAANPAVVIDESNNSIYANGIPIIIYNENDQTFLKTEDALFDSKADSISVNGFTVYGGSKDNSYSGSTSIIIENGAEIGNIYGGNRGINNLDGIDSINTPLQLNTIVTVKGGNISGDVYGGNEYGNLASLNSLVTISGNYESVLEAKEMDKNAAIEYSSRILGNVYGGSNNGGLIGTDNSASNLKVVIDGGIIGKKVFYYNFDKATGNVYGGSNGGAITNSNLNVTVKTGNIKNRVYGGSNNSDIYNSDKRDVRVSIIGGVVGPLYSSKFNHGEDPVNPTGNVFGGSNNGYVDTVSVDMSGGSIIGNIYGGGSRDSPSHSVDINYVYLNLSGGEYWHTPHGGGLLSHVGKSTVNVSGGTFLSGSSGSSTNYVDLIGGGSNSSVDSLTMIIGGGADPIQIGSIYAGGFGSNAYVEKSDILFLENAAANFYYVGGLGGSSVGSSSFEMTGGSLRYFMSGGYDYYSNKLHGVNTSKAVVKDGQISLVYMGSQIGNNKNNPNTAGVINETEFTLEGGSVQALLMGGYNGAVSESSVFNLNGGEISEIYMGGQRGIIQYPELIYNEKGMIIGSQMVTADGKITTVKKSVLNLNGGILLKDAFGFRLIHGYGINKDDVVNQLEINVNDGDSNGLDYRFILTNELSDEYAINPAGQWNTHMVVVADDAIITNKYVYKLYSQGVSDPDGPDPDGPDPDGPDPDGPDPDGPDPDYPDSGRSRPASGKIIEPANFVESLPPSVEEAMLLLNPITLVLLFFPTAIAMWVYIRKADSDE